MKDQSRKLWMLPNGNPVTQMHNGRYEEFERYGNRSGPNVLTGAVYHDELPDGAVEYTHRPLIEPVIVPMPAPRNDGNALALRILADMLDEEPDNADVLRDAYVRIHRATS